MRRGLFAITSLGTCTAALVALVTTAQAATTYSCPLSQTTICSSPLQATRAGDAKSTPDGYGFDLDGNGSPGYVQVSNSNQIAMNTFPITVSVQVKNVGVPSSQVGDYDVVRGTPAGNYKIEVVARNNRKTALSYCYFKGTKTKGVAVGGPDLSELSGWHTITCRNTGSAVQLYVDGTLAKTTSVSTGSIPNPGGLLIGAKDTHGGDQYSGYAKDVRITVG